MRTLSSHAEALELIADDLKQVDAKMQATGEVFMPLASAINLLLSSGGKRLRPALALLASKLYPAVEPERVVSLAAAVEMLHSATLVHDDVIDGSLLRRGQATLNASWSQGATILAGDFVFARAAYFAAETDSIRVMKIFSQTLMTIVEGELRQLYALRNWSQPKDAYYQRIYGKTAALFAAATESAAVLGGAPEAEIALLRDYGYHVGMAFQIMDEFWTSSATRTRSASRWAAICARALSHCRSSITFRRTQRPCRSCRRRATAMATATCWASWWPRSPNLRPSPPLDKRPFSSSRLLRPVWIRGRPAFTARRSWTWPTT